MRPSLPIRILLVHLLFSLIALSLAIVLLRDGFVRYQASWEHQLETLPGQTLYQTLAGETARSLLLRARRDTVEEVKDMERDRVSQALDVLLDELPSLQAMLIVDTEGRILYASDPAVVDLSFRGEERDLRFGSREVIRRPYLDTEGAALTELIVPIWEKFGSEVRLGTLVARYAPDPGLLQRLPELVPPSIGFRQFALPVVWFLGVSSLGAILIVWLTGRPIRRLEQAAEDFRARGYRGGLGAEPLSFGSDFSRAIRALNELGGRLEDLDTREREPADLIHEIAPRLDQGMLVIEAGGRPRGWNHSALSLLVPGTDEVDPEAIEAALVEVLRRNPQLAERASVGSTVEIVVERAVGDRVRLGCTRVPFESAPGEQGTLLLLRDHDALQLLEGRLLEAGRFAALAHVAAGLAHEIRNPLHAIGLNAEVVEQYVDAPRNERRREALDESLQAVKDETRRLTELLNNYLGLFRPERAAGPVEIARICEKVRQLLQYSATQAGVTIELDVEETLPTIDGFGSRLQQAVMNLVLNGVQAMTEGGTVTLCARRRVHDVEIVVEDDGPGLPVELADDVFRMRVTTKPEGTGIGLPLVRRVVESHGGTVTYSARAGGGARFVIHLPGNQRPSSGVRGA